MNQPPTLSSSSLLSGSLSGSQSAADDRVWVEVLKGWAIVAVVGVHVLANLPSFLYYRAPWQFWSIVFDQWSRFSVPLFIAMSGYALGRKYSQQNPTFWLFLWQRLSKLLPLYLWWSFVLIGVGWFIPVWFGDMVNWPVLQRLFFGQGDYHLYFVPLIFQFYLLFPLLWRAVKSWPITTLLVAGSTQVLAILVWQGFIAVPLPTVWTTDQAQYAIWITWWWYFVLGLWLAQLPVQLSSKSSWRWIGIWLMAILTLGWAVISAQQAINSGINPIVALRFTRLIILVYATAVIVACLRWLPSLGSLNTRWWHAWQWLGQNSFLIYLAHTLGLRIWLKSQALPLSWRLGVGVVWVGAIALSTSGVLGSIVKRFNFEPSLRFGLKPSLKFSSKSRLKGTV